MYAKWECKAAVKERATLERLRDARSGRLDDAGLMERFRVASEALTDAVRTHVAATGCTDMH